MKAVKTSGAQIQQELSLLEQHFYTNGFCLLPQRLCSGATNYKILQASLLLLNSAFRQANYAIFRGYCGSPAKLLQDNSRLGIPAARRPPSNRSRAAVSQMSLPAAGGQQAERKEFRGNKYLFLTEKFSNKHFEIRILVCFLFFFQWTFKSSIQVGK